jgi:hypothetical protein
MSDGTQKPRVVYVAGMGRSGTTLLALLLGGQPNVFGAGELRRYWQGLSTPGWLCGCGDPIESCSFWRAVRERVSSASAPQCARMLAVQAGRLRLRPGALLRLHRASGPAHRPWAREYAASVDDLYRAVAAVSGDDVIVDSSKELADGYLLSRLSALDVSVVHLVRDPRAVSHSFARRVPTPQPHREFLPRSGAVATSVKWDVRNVVAELMFRRLGDRYVRLSYEWLARDPGGALEMVASRLALPGPVSEAGLEGANHTLSGNPRRFERGTDVKLDEEWRLAMPRGRKALVTAATWPVARRYGYRSHQRRAA